MTEIDSQSPSKPRLAETDRARSWRVRDLSDYPRSLVGLVWYALSMGDEARGDDREVDHVQRLLAPFWAIVKLLVWLGICISVCITAALLVLHGRVDLGPLGDFNPWTLILGGSVITPAVALAGRSIRRRRIRAYLKGDADVGRSDPSPSADDLRRDVPRQRADQTDTKASGIARNGKRQRTAVRL